jgi:hypothetical protein
VYEGGRELFRLPVRELVVEPEPIGSYADHPAPHREVRTDELFAVVPRERIRDQEQYARSLTRGDVQAERFRKHSSRTHRSRGVEAHVQVAIPVDLVAADRVFVQEA